MLATQLDDKVLLLQHKRRMKFSPAIADGFELSVACDVCVLNDKGSLNLLRMSKSKEQQEFKQTPCSKQFSTVLTC
jgi:hypothetical protein